MGMRKLFFDHNQEEEKKLCQFANRIQELMAMLKSEE